jgi:DNA-binding CsgD family transcriptional regulator
MTKPPKRRRKEAGMKQETAPAPRRRMSVHGMILRRRRIFARLREGLSYEEIAGEEGVTSERIRQIVAETLEKRSIDGGAEHAKLQLDRLAPVMQLAALAVNSGDVAAIGPYLKVLDRFDRYQTVAGANQAYDDEARKKLLDKLSRVAANLGVDEVMWAAATERLRNQGMIGEEEGAAEGQADANLSQPPAEEKT